MKKVNNDIEGVKCVIKNYGKTTAVINYTKWSSGLIVRNQQIKPNQTVTIQYQKGSYFCASPNQVKIISEEPIVIMSKKIETKDNLFMSEKTENIKILLTTLDTVERNILEKFLNYYLKLNLDILVVTDKIENIDFIEGFGVKVVHSSKDPNGLFYNQQVDFFMKNENYTHLLMLEPDVFVQSKLIDIIRENCTKTDLIFWKDHYSITEYNELFYKSSSQDQIPLSPIKCISRKIVIELSNQLWDYYFFTDPHFHSYQKLKKFRNSKIYSINEFGGIIIKIDKNLTGLKPRELKSQINLQEINGTKKSQIVNFIEDIGFSFESRTPETEVSIIIPTYKSKKFLSECIDSILTQEGEIKKEILIGIDACNETLDYIKNNDNILSNCSIYFFEENNGPYFIRNSLLKECNYENILFFDSDDVMKPNLIKDTLSKLSDHDCVRWKFENFSGDLSDAKFQLNRYHAHGVFAIKKRIIEKMNGFLPWRMGADSEFLERSKHQNMDIGFTKDVMFYRRQHPDNQTHNKLTGKGTTARNEIQKILKDKISKKSFVNPDFLNTKNFTKI
jgi:hypothetical protein